MKHRDVSTFIAALQRTTMMKKDPPAEIFNAGNEAVQMRASTTMRSPI